MESIVVYNNNVETLLQKAGFTVGYVTTVDEITSASMVKLWYSGMSVIAVYYADNVIRNIKYCNDNKSLHPRDTTFTKFFNELKEIVTAKPMFPPSLLNTFTNILFDEYDANPVKLDKILMSVPHQNKEFISLFQSEIDQLTQDNTNITTTPEQFQFYRDCQRKELHYISEAYEATVLLHNLSSISQSTKILDLRELSNNYVKVEMPTAATSLVVRAIGALSEVTNPHRVVEILTALGYKGLEAFNSVSVPPNIHFESVPLIADEDSLSRSIYFNEDEWTLSVGCDTLVGYCHLRCVDGYNRNLTEFSDIKELIRPYLFVRFATRFLSDLLSSANFVLNSMPDVRTYCYQLLKAYDCIQDPPPAMLNYEMMWSDVGAGQFDPFKYIEMNYDVDVRTLPTASVKACKNEQEVKELVQQLRGLLEMK